MAAETPLAEALEGTGYTVETYNNALVSFFRGDESALDCFKRLSEEKRGQISQAMLLENAREREVRIQEEMRKAAEDQFTMDEILEGSIVVGINLTHSAERKALDWVILHKEGGKVTEMSRCTYDVENESRLIMAVDSLYGDLRKYQVETGIYDQFDCQRFESACRTVDAAKAGCQDVGAERILESRLHMVGFGAHLKAETLKRANECFLTSINFQALPGGSAAAIYEDSGYGQAVFHAVHALVTLCRVIQEEGRN